MAENRQQKRNVVLMVFIQAHIIYDVKYSLIELIWKQKASL